MDLEIRTPDVSDADGLGRVHVRAWRAAYRGGLMPEEYLDSLSETDRASMWRTSLENAPSSRRARFVATVDGEVAGFALVGPSDGDDGSDTGELYAINVDPDHWGTGVGAALIDAAMDALHTDGFERCVLWVHPDNARARTFYARRGWTDDDVDRRQEVLGVDVPETRLSRRLSA